MKKSRIGLIAGLMGQGKIMKARTPQGFAIGIHYSFLPVFASALSPL